VTSVNVTVAGAPIIARGDRQPAGPFHLRILGLTGRPCAVLASTDLVHWGPIGAAMETAPGVFEFDDPDASAYPVRFYLIRQ